MKRFFPLITAAICLSMAIQSCREQAPAKLRVLVSTDIGGTDPDDNQSFAHLLMYSDLFDLEGIVSSPANGGGNVGEMHRMIDLYAKDYPTLREHAPVMAPDDLYPLCKQGRRGDMPWAGYDEPTEGSEWIIECARKKDSRPLWVLVWGMLDDVAQALHDAPDIAPKLHVYYIAGPNKKWGANSYAYVVENFPDLWMIECNDSYRGFFGNYDSPKVDYEDGAGYYDRAIRGAGTLGADFINYYKGMPKMGDTPSLLYLMNGDPEDPEGESWGGSFTRAGRASRRIMHHPLSQRDTLPIFGILELNFDGPATDIPADSACLRVTIDRQVWPGFQVSPGKYAVRYASREAKQMTYETASAIAELDGLKGEFTVSKGWPGPAADEDYLTGDHWYTDRPEPEYAIGKAQGAMTVAKWRKEAMDDWASRWAWLKSGRPRVIVTTDGEIDDECSLVRFLLYCNEWDVEAIVTSSSQYHWRGHKWAGDNWMDNVMGAYEQVYPTLVQHDGRYPSPEFLRERSLLGNVDAEGEMDQVTAGSRRIVEVLLDEGDPRPVWIQAWGGVNTLARALKTIEEEYPERMAEVAAKVRLYNIWEQDSTYQTYIRPHWEHLGMLTIISDQFEAIAYRWHTAQPEENWPWLESAWMKRWILGVGPLGATYRACLKGEWFNPTNVSDVPREGAFPVVEGDFRSEGDSPSYMYVIPTGMNDPEHPDWGSWGGRYTRVRENVWMDPVPDGSWSYPDGRISSANTWGRLTLKGEIPSTPEQVAEYFRPMTRWTRAMQNDFAARMSWTVLPEKEANHQPSVSLETDFEQDVKPGQTVTVRVTALDPDGDSLTVRWWQYDEAGSCPVQASITAPDAVETGIVVPTDAPAGSTLHFICEVTDNGTPALTRYARTILKVRQ